MKSRLTIATLALTAFALCSCDNTNKSTSAQANTAAFTEYFTSTLPDGAVAVGEARKSIAEGQEEIIVEGMLVSNAQVFHPSSALFFVCDDSKIKRSGADAGQEHVHEHGETCDHEHGDHEAPHDHSTAIATEGEFDWCCTDPAALKEALLAVQVVDKDGKRIPATIKGINNMQEKAMVVIKGKPAVTSTKEAPLLNATEIYVVPGK